uniref:Uncharacterized protein n=1 Tax=Sphaerodactylus townsendi TaxID=933632 RepID=A0ACB8FAV1_9SAUR
MARRIRERALAGYYVDVFDMAKPSGQPGVTGPCFLWEIVTIGMTIRSASHSATARWDVIEQRIWTLKVQAFTKQGQARGQRAGGAKKGRGRLDCTSWGSKFEVLVREQSHANGIVPWHVATFGFSTF